MNRGFTIIELVVVMGIVTVISAMTLAGYSRFGGQIMLRNLAYDVALTVREVQVHGISAKVFASEGVARGQGIVFGESPTSATEFYVFTDNDPEDNYYSGIDEVLSGQEYFIGKGYVINALCATTGGSEDCAMQAVSIVFKRPEPDALIRADRGAGYDSFFYDTTRIVLKSPQDQCLAVVVEAAGQISVQRATCL